MPELDKLLIIDTYVTDLIAQIKTLSTQMNNDLNAAKAIAHDRKIALNRLHKKLSQAKAALTPDDMNALREITAMEEQYSYKSQSQIEAENEVSSRSA